MAVRWIDGEIQRLRVLRAELIPVRTGLSPEREGQVRRAILSGRAPRAVPHWTQRPENRGKMNATVRKMKRAKAKAKKEAEDAASTSRQG